MRDWVLNPHVKAGNNVLAQMKEFASSVHSSPALLQLAGRLLQGIDLRVGWVLTCIGHGC
jgi:hypothetical protein